MPHLPSTIILAMEWLAPALTPPTLCAWLGLAYVTRPRTRTKAQLRQHRRRWATRRKRVRNFVARFLTYRIAVSVLGVTTGGALAMCAPQLLPAHAAPDFFSTTAQVLPAFLVALAVDQRLTHGVGTQDEYIGRAEDAFLTAQSAWIAGENLKPASALRLDDGIGDEFQWIWSYVPLAMYSADPDDYPDICALARARYRLQRRGAAAFVLLAVASLLIGEAAAVIGMASNDPQVAGAPFRIALGALVASTLLVVLGGLQDLLRGVTRSS